MKAFLREPLVQFLLLGAFLFVVFGLIGQLNLSRPEEIIVTPERIAALQKSFEFDFGHPPTAAETEKLIQDYIREEVLVREAVKLGFHTDDQKIRFLLRQRMEIEQAAVPEPTQEELGQFLKDHADQFHPPGKPVPSLEEAEPTVRSAWKARKRKEISDAAYQGYLKKYIVKVETPKTPTTTSSTQ